MLHFINIVDGSIGLSIYDRTRLSQPQPVKRGDDEPYQVVFHRNGAPVDLDPAGGETLKFGVKVQEDEDGAYVFSLSGGVGTGWTKTNGTVFADAVINAGTLLTSATAAFNQDDVDLPISGAGIPAGTTIKAVGAIAGGTSVTLSQAATTSGTITIAIAGRMTTYTAAPSFDTTKGNNLLGYDPFGFAEETLIETVPDVSMSLDATYFVLHDKNGSVGVWIDVGNHGAPMPAGAGACTRQIEFNTFAANATAAQIATALASLLDADAQFAAAADGEMVIVTDAVIGIRATHAADGNTGFGISTWIDGSAPRTMPNLPSEDLDAELEWIALGKRHSSQTFTLELDFDINQDEQATAALATSSQRMRQAVGNGVTFFDVVFPAAFASVPILAGAPIMEKALAADDNIAVVSVSTITTTGFRAHFNSATPNANYHIHAVALPL